MPADFAYLKAIAKELPGTEESTSYGTPALKVKGKLIARMWEDGKTLVLITTFDDRDFLMQHSPEVFYITEHYRNYPAVLVRLGKVRRTQLRELLEDAWRRVAPKRAIEGLATRPKRR